MCLKKNEIKVLITKMKKDLKYTNLNNIRRVYLREKIKLLNEYLKYNPNK